MDLLHVYRRYYRECRGGGDVSLDYVDGRWEVLFLISDVSERRRYRFWIVAFLDYITC